MRYDLAISIGQHSDKGRKETNQDFYGILVPEQPELARKGIALALTDGISSSSVGAIAAEMAVKSFLTDYYCTSDTWTVKTSAQRVIAAINGWLHAQTRRSQFSEDRDKGYVCTFSAMVIKGTSAHLFHIGDSRIYRLTGSSLEQLTTDHRVAVSAEQSYLGRALGVNPQVEIDYRILHLARGDTFVLATDGVYEHVRPAFIAKMIEEKGRDLDAACQAIIAEAFTRDSADNLTIQIVRIDDLPAVEADDPVGPASDLPLPPLLEPRAVFDGYRIIRQLHASSRSHIYLAMDLDEDRKVALKIPSIDLRDDPAYIKRFMMEEWVARRIDNPHVLKPYRGNRQRNFLYVVMDYIDGQTLRQWMIDNPRPSLETVRAIVEQIAKGLRGFHRKEMLHQDLRPDNIMIDASGIVTLIDFGSTRVAGVVENKPTNEDAAILGTVQYTAPEYFVGDRVSATSDLFSLGVITYQMLTGHLPYGARLARAQSRSKMRKVRYTSASDFNHDVPAWIDGALRRAVAIAPAQRYDALSEFVHDLREPNAAFVRAVPLAERNPLRFWQALSWILLACNIVTLVVLAKR
jgi:serine/threonine protein phosphatase PrpC